MIDRYQFPWRVSQEGPPSIVDASGRYVCEGAGGDGLEFICRVVNSHAELLAACKDARSVIRCMSGDTLAVLRQLDAAIAKGEGAA